MSATTSPEDETERLRRHLRALSAVNRQLHAQLESGAARVVDPGRARDDILAGDDVGARISMLSIRRAPPAASGSNNCNCSPVHPIRSSRAVRIAARSSSRARIAARSRRACSSLRSSA